MRVVRGGEVTGALEFNADGHGGWLLMGSSLCGDLSTGWARPTSISGAPTCSGDDDLASAAGSGPLLRCGQRPGRQTGAISNAFVPAAPPIVGAYAAWPFVLGGADPTPHRSRRLPKHVRHRCTTGPTGDGPRVTPELGDERLLLGSFR